MATKQKPNSTMYCRRFCLSDTLRNVHLL
uniref:Uncharacterized protein n=1 Tax=Anguilla anguilla TaxID=7936 RepID=A0A0E9QXN3_ANGAN